MITADEPRLPGGPGYGPLVETLRQLLDAAAAADPPDDVIDEAVRHLRTATDLLSCGQVDETRQPAGRRPDLPSRGNPMLPPLVRLDERPGEVRYTVTFTRAHLGGGAAVHGGQLPLLFDDVLGRLAGHDRPPSRTAYLHVEYHRITPLDTPLQVRARIDRVDGRKIVATGTVSHDRAVTAEASGLFVIVRPELQEILAARRI